MQTNKTKARLKAGETVYGCFTRYPDPTLVEVLTYSGWDFLVFDGEHGTIEPRDCENMVRAAEIRGTTPIVRVATNAAPTILRMMDSGAHGLHVPWVNSAEEAEAVVRAVKYQPRGVRGLAGIRAADYGQAGTLGDYVRTANAETLVVKAARRLMAEHGPDVSMEDIARHAGVGVGTLYRSFGSKDALIAALRTAACADARHCLHQASAGERDPRRRLRRLVIEQYRRNLQHAALLDAAQDRPLAAGQDIAAMLFELLYAIIREGQRQGVMRAGDTTFLALACLQLLQPRAARQLSHGADLDATAEQVADFMLRALAPTRNDE